MNNLIVPQWIVPVPGIGALSTTRCGGVSDAPYDDGVGGGGLNLGLHVGDAAVRVMENRARLQAALPAPPVWLSQVHGATVVDAAAVTGVPEADASFTVQPGVVCVVHCFLRGLVHLSCHFVVRVHVCSLRSRHVQSRMRGRQPWDGPEDLPGTVCGSRVADG